MKKTLINFLRLLLGHCHVVIRSYITGTVVMALYITRDQLQPITLLFLLIMPCCSALKIHDHLLCSILCSRTRIVVRLLWYLGQHLLIPCFLSSAKNLASEGRRLLLLILIIHYFEQCYGVTVF